MAILTTSGRWFLLVSSLHDGYRVVLADFFVTMHPSGSKRPVFTVR
jgi:hypothetical protein